VDVLITAGLQVPATPSLEVAGNTGAIAFWQIEVGTVAKVGMRLVTTVIVTETGFAH